MKIKSIKDCVNYSVKYYDVDGRFLISQDYWSLEKIEELKNEDESIFYLSDKYLKYIAGINQKHYKVSKNLDIPYDLIQDGEFSYSMFEEWCNLLEEENYPAIRGLFVCLCRFRDWGGNSNNRKQYRSMANIILNKYMPILQKNWHIYQNNGYKQNNPINSNFNGVSLLRSAVIVNDISLVSQMLKEYKADPNYFDNPLQLAVDKEYYDIVKVLVKYGANVNVKIDDFISNKIRRECGLPEEVYYDPRQKNEYIRYEDSRDGGIWVNH